MTQAKILIGAHMSIAGGLEKSLTRGKEIGCTVIQIFTHSNRQWHMKDLDPQECALFKSTAKELAVDCVAHASYLLNIGSPLEETRKKSLITLAKEVQRAQELAIPYVVLHSGAHLNTSPSECIQKIAEVLDAVCETITGPTMIVLENMAGQGSVMGRTFEELAAIRYQAKHKKRIGFCFDTCHAFAAGYDFTTPELYKSMWQQFDDILGLENLKILHLNDSKNKCNSRIDRHEHIGKGALGLEPFRLIMNDPRFKNIPKIIETPKGEVSLIEDKKNLEILKKLLK